MVHNMLARLPMRFMTDAALGLAVFAAATAVTMGPSALGGWFSMGARAAGLASAHPVASLAVAANDSGSPTVLAVLAAVFSMLFALNFAFLRHLRQTVTVARKTHGASLSDDRAESH